MASGSSFLLALILNMKLKATIEMAACGMVAAGVISSQLMEKDRNNGCKRTDPTGEAGWVLRRLIAVSTSIPLAMFQSRFLDEARSRIIPFLGKMSQQKDLLPCPMN